MQISNFRKETSERSDVYNWAKKELIENTPYFFESIEGCNQNANHQVTHLFERARVSIVEEGEINLNNIFEQIKLLEGTESLTRKINFAKSLELPLHYVLYCDELQKVLLFQIINLNEFSFEEIFETYQDFSIWISTIKGWVSNKKFRESDDLPFFDKKLREAQTAWPTNIDCFFTDKSNNPIGIIEFQNADLIGVLKHCNNDYFQCKISREVEGYYGPKTIYHDDIRRWTSQEILRVQSGLRLIIITWSKNNKDFQLKELEKVSIPYFPLKDGKNDWKYMNKYKGALHTYVIGGRTKRIEDNIAQNAKTYNLYKEVDNIRTTVNEPVLSYETKTFPSLYYSSKVATNDEKTKLVDTFIKILS